MNHALKVPLLLGVVILVAGERLSTEVLIRVLPDGVLVDPTSVLVIYGGATLLVAVLAAIVCRRLAVARGVSPAVGLGAGVAICAFALADGLRLMVDAVLWATDFWPWFFLSEAETLLMALLVFVGLRMVGARAWAAIAVVVGLVAFMWLVDSAYVRVAVASYERDNWRTVQEIRYWVVHIGFPSLVALAVLLVARLPAKEPTPEVTRS